MDEGNVSFSRPSRSRVRAMEEEMSSLKKNHTWELVDQPPGQKLVSCKCLFKIKEGIEGVQKSRVILSLTACEDYELEQLDVKTTFLHGNLEETICMRQLLGFEEGTGNKSEIKYTKGLLRKEFDMKELGPARKILGMKIVKRSDEGKHVDVDGFVYADYAKDRDKGRSITRYVFKVHGCVVSWKETMQHVVALSTTEAEYMELTKVVKESIWLKGLLIELGVNLRSVVMNCDNHSTIHLSRNAMFHERTKHINVRYHFIIEIAESKEIEVAKIGTKDNVADTFTKGSLVLQLRELLQSVLGFRDIDLRGSDGNFGKRLVVAVDDGSDDGGVVKKKVGLRLRGKLAAINTTKQGWCCCCYGFKDGLKTDVLGHYNELKDLRKLAKIGKLVFY
ncbi:hypothetical protein Tco_0604866 [Tanacetum coccineum]